MSRNGSGTYTLPVGNPVVTGTTIESTWANNTLSDIATEITNSLSRTGAGGMTGAFRAANGTSTVPGIAWGDETGTGFYRAGTSDTRLVIQTALLQKWTASGSEITGTFGATGNISFDGGSFTFNESGADKDARFEGDTDANLLFTDASTDRVGVGTNAPGAKLSVDSDATALFVNFNSNNANGGFARFQNSGTSIADLGSGANLVSSGGSATDFGLNSRTGSLIFSTGQIERGRFDSSGNFGIGTTTPGALLHLNSAAGGGDLPRMRFTNGGTGTGATDGSFVGVSNTNQLDIWNYESAEVRIGTSNTERARITSAGDLQFQATGSAVSNVASINGGQLAGMRNKIINGAMDIAQRGTSFAAAANIYTLDRWALTGVFGTAVATVTQATDSLPSTNEFQYAFKADITTADTSIAAGEYVQIQQPIEGFNVRDLIGRTFTLSFWVRSPKTGTHCVAFTNSTPDRSYVAEYTVSAANTWEQKSITVSGGLITAGTWNWTNGLGLRVSWALATGSTFQTTAGAWQTGAFYATSNQVNCLDSTANDFYLTGVQLEVGGVATPFEHRPYGAELVLCQRYYQISSAEAYLATYSTQVGAPVSLAVTMRSNISMPTYTVNSQTGNAATWPRGSVTSTSAWMLSMNPSSANTTVYGNITAFLSAEL